MPASSPLTSVEFAQALKPKPSREPRPPSSVKEAVELWLKRKPRGVLLVRKRRGRAGNHRRLRRRQGLTRLVHQ
jgi:hypothetical protein